MSELSRKAFEAAVLRDWPAANLNRCPSVSSRAGQYADEIVQRAWWGWQASRAVLVITLPSTECFGEYSEEAARVMRDGCADAIEEQGIKFEVSQ